jgi:hypothetical protein
MTERSKRRRAEMAVINAAVGYVTATDDHYLKRVNLDAAVAEYEALGMAQLADRGTTSNNSTDTSAQAAASLGDISGDAKRCFDEIVLAGGLTVYQLTWMLGRPHQTVSARVNDLMNKGWVVDSGIRRKTKSGRNAIVWAPSLLAAAVLP